MPRGQITEWLVEIDDVPIGQSAIFPDCPDVIPTSEAVLIPPSSAASV